MFLQKFNLDLAMYKINKFHWHLTEDQGWRIEIKKSPIPMATSTTVYIRTVLVSEKMGPVRSIEVKRQNPIDAVQIDAKNKGLKLRIAEGEYYDCNKTRTIEK